MKCSPRTAEIMARMAPGAIVRDGMLGRDARSLPEIVADDTALVAALGLDHAAIAARMAELTRAGREGFGDRCAVGDDYEVHVVEVAGRMPSPFGDGVFRKAVTYATHLRTGEEARWSDLGLHMIRGHGFYQGKGSPWRLEPEFLARFLGLA